MIQRLLRGCGHIACTYYRTVLCVAVLLTGLSLIPPLMFGAKVYVSVSKMMPKEIPAAQAFNRALQDFGTADEVFVIFRLRDKKSIAAVGQYVIKLADKMRAHPEFQDAYCQYIRPEEKGFLQKLLLREGLIYLPEAGIKEAQQELSDKNIARNVRKTLNRLSTPGSDKAEKLIRLNALNIFPLFKKYMGGTYSHMGQEREGTLMTASDGKGAIILLAAQPYGPAQRLEYAKRIMQIVRQLSSNIVKTMPPALQNQVKVDYAGGYEVAMRYSHHVKDSLKWTLISSLIGVLLLFGYCYRRYGVLIYVGIPLVMIVCWTIGAGWLMFGKLNMISCAFAAVLIGLGVDYAVHIYNRYVEERCNGHKVEDSFVNALEHTGRGVFVGMLTTSMSFFALTVTRFSGLSQFGILAGTGLALALPGMVFVLPALVVWRSKKHQGEHPRALSSSSFALPFLARLVERRALPIAIIGISLAVASGLYVCFGKNTVQFDERLASLRPTKDNVFKLGKEIAGKFSRKSPARLMLLITGNTEAEALNNATGILPKLTALKKEGTLHDFEVLTQLLPAPVEQQKRRIQLGKIDFAKAGKVLRKRLEREGLDERAFKDSFDFLENQQKLMNSSRVILPTDFKGTAAWRLMHRLVGRHKEHYSMREAAQRLKKEPVVIAVTPTSREGIRYFAQGTKISTAALNYLEKLGIKSVKCREYAQDKQTAKGKPTTSKTLAQIRKLKEDGKQQAFAENVLRSDGKQILAPGTIVSQEIIDYLKVSDCRKISVYGKGWTVLAYIYPPDNELNKLEFSDKWVTKIRSKLGIDPLDPNAKLMLTGTMLVAHDLATIVKEDFIKITIWVSIIVTIVLLICYHNLLRVLFSITPIALSLLYLVGIMSLGEIYFNFINVLVIPIIIGLGVDNGIHLVHRFFQAGRQVQPMIVETGRAIVITNLTSMVGFGSLWFGSYKGLSSMGMLSVLGLSMSITASLIVLPAILQVCFGKRTV